MGMSFEMAEKLYSLSCFGILAGLVIGVLFTGTSLYAGRIKEEYLSLELERSKERTAESLAKVEQIKKELAWRRLSGEQRQILISELRAYPAKIVVTNMSGDSEAMVFAEDISKALGDAGWDSSRSSLMWDDDFISGIFVSRTNNGDDERLRNSLLSAGIATELAAPAEEFRLTIGSKSSM